MTTKKKKQTNTKQTAKAKSTMKQKSTNNVRINFIVATLFLLSAVALLMSFISYFTNGAYDQSIVNELNNRNLKPQNLIGKLGAWLSHKFIYEGFGIASFIFVKIFAQIGLWFGLKFRATKLRQMIFWDVFALLIISLALGHFGSTKPYLGGVVGFEINDYLQDYLGQIGTLLVVVFFILFYLIFRIKMSPSFFTNIVTNTHSKLKENLEKAEEIIHSQPDNNSASKPFKIKEEKPTEPVEVNKELETPTLSHPEMEPEETVVDPIDMDLTPTIDSAPKKEESAHNERSEERRVGKECRSRGPPKHAKAT